jgi:glycosyltransferase involved in cell wall biosynthesis
VRLLFISFSMDTESPVLSWQHSVATQLAERCEKVVVLTEHVGRHQLPANVELHTVPRLFTTPLRMLGAKWLMNVPVWRWCLRHRFDAVFIHMNAEWAYRLAPVWRRFDLPVVMWYAHGTVTGRLHRAHAHVTRVVTSSPEGFRIASDKVRIIGQGIDTRLFAPPAHPPAGATIAVVGRVSRRKSVDLAIETLAWLRAHAPQHPFALRIVGPSLTRDDAAYAEELKALVAARGLEGAVQFDGPRPRPALPAVYGDSFLHLNLSETGSIDKAILESLACGCPTLTSNVAAFGPLAEVPELIIRDRSPDAIGARIVRLYEERASLTPGRLRGLITGRHDLDSYADRVSAVLEECVGERAAAAGLRRVA